MMQLLGLYQWVDSPTWASPWQWSGNQCQLRDDERRQLEVRVLQGCPMVSLADGQRILEWLEHYQAHQQWKLAMVRSLL